AVWALGAILYEMSTGRTPFVGETTMQVLFKICYEPYEPIETYRADTPPVFAALVAGAMSRDAKLRIMDVDDLRQRLRAALAPIAPQAFKEPLASGELPLHGVGGGGPPTTLGRATGQVTSSTAARKRGRP